MSRLSHFEARVVPYLDSAYNLARWLTRNDEDARDVVQDAFLRAFRFFDALEDPDARAWLLAIVRNTAFTWLRKNRPADMVAIDDETQLSAADESLGHASPADPNPEVIVLESANRKLINLALEELPVAYREVLVLREIEDLSYKDIAQVAGVPIGTVMSRLARGREMLKRTLATRLRKAS